MMVSRKVALLLRWVLLAVMSQSLRVMEFRPSMHTPSDRLLVRVALLTVMSAVE